jgi:hypothetical protein
MERGVVDTIKFWDLDYEDRMKVDQSFAKSGGSMTMQQWADYLFDDLGCPFFSDCEGWYQTYCTQLMNQGSRSIRSDWYAQRPEKGINAFTGLSWGRSGSTPVPSQKMNTSEVCSTTVINGCLSGIVGLIVVVFMLSMCVKGC